MEVKPYFNPDFCIRIVIDLLFLHSMVQCRSRYRIWVIAKLFGTKLTSIYIRRSFLQLYVALTAAIQDN